jgi:hypothetical protein
MAHPGDVEDVDAVGELLAVAEAMDRRCWLDARRGRDLYVCGDLSDQALDDLEDAVEAQLALRLALSTDYEAALRALPPRPLSAPPMLLCFDGGLR